MNQLLSRELAAGILKPKYKEFVKYTRYKSSGVESSTQRIFPEDKWLIKKTLRSLLKTWRNWMEELDAKCGSMSELPPTAKGNSVDAEVAKYKAWTIVCLARKHVYNLQQSNSYRRITKSSAETFHRYEDMASDFLEKTFKEKRK